MTSHTEEDELSTYRTVVVGTDGSDSSLRAVDRAGAIAAASNANLIVATAHFPHAVDTRAADALGAEGYKMAGNAPVYSILRDARDRAKEAGAADIKERAILGAPVEALLDLADEVDADLLVVGSVGLGTVKGRLLGSVPASISRKARVDVLIVHTT
jgi:nucleotide-binding universal stress UspA family protein